MQHHDIVNCDDKIILQQRTARRSGLLGCVIEMTRKTLNCARHPIFAVVRTKIRKLSAPPVPPHKDDAGQKEDRRFDGRHGPLDKNLDGPGHIEGVILEPGHHSREAHSDSGG